MVCQFSSIAKYLGRLRPPELQVRGDGNGLTVAEEISWAVECSARLLPFRVVCLPQALAGWQMLQLRRVPGRLHLGAAQGQGGKTLLTHAWLDACGVRITGYPVGRDCVEIGYFER